LKIAFELWGGYLAYGIGGILAIAFAVGHGVRTRRSNFSTQKREHSHAQAA